MGPGFRRDDEGDELDLRHHHWPQRPSRQDMQVEMWYFLPAVEAGIGDGAVSALTDPQLFNHFAERPVKPGDLLGRRIACEIGDRDIRPLRNDQNMDRGLRCNVVKAIAKSSS